MHYAETWPGAQVVKHSGLLQSANTAMLQQKLQLRTPYVTPLNLLQVRTAPEGPRHISQLARSLHDHLYIGGVHHELQDTVPCALELVHLMGLAGILAVHPLSLGPVKMVTLHLPSPNHGEATASEKRRPWRLVRPARVSHAALCTRKGK